MSTEENPKENGPKSAWEIADNLASGAEKVGAGLEWLLLKGYAIVLIILGIAAFFLLDGASKLAGFPLAGYGVYLLLGGSWVIW